MNDLSYVNAKLKSSWYLLKISYGLLYIVVGIDKFFNFIVNWSQYVNPMILTTFNIDYATLKIIIAVIEVVIGLLILTNWTRIGAYLAAAWFLIIAIQLILMWQYLDVAARDVLLAFGAISLAWITEALKSPTR